MTKKERITQLEKELEELKQRVMILESLGLIGVGDIHDPWTPAPIYPIYPWTPTIPYPYPIITWSDTTGDTVNTRLQ